MTCLLANIYQSEDPTGYFLSEKLDGYRAIWNGKKLISRHGNSIDIPDSILKLLPKNIPLDGELWAGRKQFSTAASIIKNGRKDYRWNKITYYVFDIPEPTLGPVEKRWEYLRSVVSGINNNQIKYLNQTVCEGTEHLFKVLDLVVSSGGEGIMLRKPKSIYAKTRSDTLLKLKKFLDDDAIVIGYEKSEVSTIGKSHLIGSVGALVCKNKNGIQFKVGSGLSDNQRLNPPKIGSVITYKYQELSNDGVPRFPTFLREKILP